MTGGTPENRGAARIAERCHVSFRSISADGVSSDSDSSSGGSTGQAATQNPGRTIGETLNLSASGLCLASPTLLRPDDHLALELTLSNSETPVVAMGRVVWCDPDGEVFRVGICFTWLRDEDRTELGKVASFVQDRL